MSSVIINPTSASQTGSDWTNINGIIGSGTATDTITGTATTGTLAALGFPSNQIPGGATINGIELQGSAWGGGGTNIAWNALELVINSHNSGMLQTGNIGASQTNLTYGSSSTQPGSLSVSASDINTGSMSVGMSFTGNLSNSSSQVNVQEWFLTVYYTTVNQVTPQCVTIRAAFVERD